MRSPAFRAQAFRKNFQNVYTAGLDAGHATRRSSLVQPTGGRRSELPVALPQHPQGASTVSRTCADRGRRSRFFSRSRETKRD